MTAGKTLIHGTAVAVAVDADGPLCGALMIGASGAGKSSVALAILDGCPWRRSALIADDTVLLSRVGGNIVAEAPAATKGLIEIRGYGPVTVPGGEALSLTAGFDLSAPAGRLPASAAFRPEGLDGEGLPTWPFEPGHNAASRIRRILRAIIGGQIP